MFYEKYEPMTWMQIAGKLRMNGERTDFTWNATDGMKLDQVEDAAYAVNVNFDIDKAMEQIKDGNDLSGTLAASQVEFCCG